MADTEQSQPASGTRKSRRKAAMKVREELANALKDDDDKDGNKNDNKESQKCDSPPRNTNSPDPNCAICLCRLENKSFTDSCFHMFCFVCLLEWSKIKAECPLCKQPFKSIIHNVRSYDDYDQYHLERAENPFEAPNGRRFRYRTTVTQDYMFGVRPSRHATHAPTMSSRTLTSTSEYRRRIYTNGMRVVGLRDSCGRSRNIAPVFFSSNPAASHRLVPWLNRELNALLYNQEEHVQFVLQLIIDLIKHFPLQSEEFYQHVYPFIGRHTRHFMHEFEAFAKSPFCISSYDQRAVYERQAESVSDTDSDPSDNGNDSDVMIVSTSTAPADSGRRDPGGVRRHNLPPDLTPYSASLRDLLEEDDNGPSQSGWNSPIPGPSWHLTHLPSSSLSLLQLPGTSTQSRSQSGKRKTSRLGGAAAGADDSDESEPEVVVWSDSDSGDEVLCVGYDKPWQERTPVLVSTDSEEDKIAKKPVKAKKDTIKKEDDAKKSKRRRSRSHSRHRRRRGSSSSQSTRRRSRSRSRNKLQRSRHANRSKSPSRRDRRRSPSPSGSRHRRHHRSVAYEDAFGYSRRTIRSERNSVDSRGSRHSEGKGRRKREHHQHSKHSFSSSRSCSMSPSKSRRRIRSKDTSTRRRSRTRSSSSELVSRHKHKKSKKHKRSRDSEKDQRNSDSVQYKIVKDKKSDKKGDPLMSITIKRDKSEDIQVVSSTVDSTANANVAIEIPDNVVIRTEPVSPPSRSQRPTPSAEPSEVLAETISLESNSNTSSDKPRSPKPSKSSSSSGKHVEDSDSSAGTSEVRKKAFKKHPSGHKKTRRPLPRIPDPLPSTVSSCTPPQTMPVLDIMSQFFPNFGSPSTCTPPVSQDYPIPGMMTNYFDSRHFYLCGLPGPCLPNFPPSVLPSSSRVTSSDQAVVVSSSEDSDVVVEMVKNLSGHKVSSSVIHSGLNLDFLDRIPGISGSISDHRSIDVSEEIDVEDSDSDTICKSGSSGKAHVTEVFDSDDDDSTEHKSSSESGELRGLDTVRSLLKSQSPSSSVQGKESTTRDKEGSPRVEHSSPPDSPPSSERITSTKDQGKTSRETDVDTAEATTDDSMDIDVGGPELCGQAIECCDESTSATCPSESDKSMEIDVVGSDTSRNESPMIVVGSSVNDATSDATTSGNVHEQQPILKVNQSELASSVTVFDRLQREQQSSQDDVSSDSNVNNNSAACVRGIESTPASPCDASGCFQTPQSDCGQESGVQNTAVDLRTDSNSDSKPKPNSIEGWPVSIPLIEGASEISSEDEEEDASVSKRPSQVIADVSDISSDESDYDDLSFPLDPMYSSTYLQVIDVDSASSDDAGRSTRPAAVQKTISISDVSSDEVGELESSRSGYSEHNTTVSTPPTSHDSDPTAPPTGSDNRDRSSSADNASHSSGELSSGEISDDSSDDQKVYDDISSSENFDSSGEASPGESSPRRPTSSDVPGQTCPHDDSLSEGEIVSD